MDNEIYIRPETDTHTKTFWHATALRSTPIPAEKSHDGKPGWHSQENFVCTHDHQSRKSADECSQQLARALRHGPVPAWAITR